MRLVSEERPQQAGTVASIALLLFGGLSAFALVVWFRTSAEPLSWKAMLTGVVALGSFGASAMLWTSPKRVAAVLGLVLMLASLARVGAPADWTGYSFVLVAITAVLMMPVVHAALVLRSS
ncbi:MAG: hypothetical protein HOO96_23405 [Polyangiaceae bacterium]|nr:hypothetical protein [Polyangiaceae bacterium]